MLTLFSAALFLIGLGLAAWKIRSRSYFILNSYFWGFTLAVGIFAIPPDADTYRMVIVLPAAILLAAIALDQIVEVVGLNWNNTRLGYSFVVVITLASLVTTNLWTYYGEFVGHCLYGGDLTTRFASYLGSYVATVQREETVYLLSDGTYFYGSHDSVNFLSNSRKIINVKDSVSTLKAKPGEAIIAAPNRLDELRAWADANPGGKLHNFYDCNNLIMMTYQFP